MSRVIRRHLLPHATFGDDPSGWCSCAGCDPREDCDCPSCTEARDADEWRGYNEKVDTPAAGAWDQEHGAACVYWPDCQSNGDHPNPHIYPEA